METIEYWKPVRMAWQRMLDTLFRPFDISKWFVIGFAAWIAGATTWTGGFSGGSPNRADASTPVSTQGIAEIWHQYQSLIIIWGSIGLALGLVIFLALTWLHARGNFVFLDNALHNRGAIVEPWKRCAAQGNSLFRWRIAVGLASFFILVTIIAGSGMMMIPMIRSNTRIGMGVAGIVLGFGFLLFFLVVLAYLHIIVYDFIIPLMYRDNLTILLAWSRFSRIMRSNWEKFILWGLVRWVVGMLVGMAVFMAVILSCCLLGCIFSIPYIGTVAYLPVTVFTRFLGPEFMRQFGFDYTLAGIVDPTPAPPLSEGGLET